jgi:phosphoribosylaminoimidazole carboxylase (NCAIR synthetase)
MPAYANQQSADQAPIPRIYWNDYHKTARAGRKIGHVTVTAESEAGLRSRAAQLAGELGVAVEINLETVMQGLGHQET